MSTVSVLHYRTIAADHRKTAAHEKLSNRREMHERSAAIFEEMAQSIEDTAGLARENALAKLEREAEVRRLWETRERSA